MRKICNNCRLPRIDDILNVKCMDCDKFICDLCLEGDLLKGVKCNRCDYRWWENRLRQMIEETTYVRNRYFELKAKAKQQDNFEIETLDGCRVYDSEDSDSEDSDSDYTEYDGDTLKGAKAYDSDDSYQPVK